MEDKRGVFSHISGIIRLVTFIILVVLLVFFVVRIVRSRQSAQRAREAVKVAEQSEKTGSGGQKDDQQSSQDDRSDSASSGNSSQIPSGIAESDLGQPTAENGRLPAAGTDMSIVVTSAAIMVLTYVTVWFRQGKRAVNFQNGL